jgi:hypothetical protein
MSPNNVAQFRRPELDEEIGTALEQQELSEKALQFLADQHRRIRRVRDAVRMSAEPGALAMLTLDLESLDSEIEYAREMVEHWKAIRAILIRRTARV